MSTPREILDRMAKCNKRQLDRASNEEDAVSEVNAFAMKYLIEAMGEALRQLEEASLTKDLEHSLLMVDRRQA